jgi:aryl-alcohol dehydrogenase-like predicted oxidoreductase
MMFGVEGNPDRDECTGMIHAALDAGINFIDTADAYGGPDGESELIVGAALRGRRDDVVLATKVHFPMGERPNRSGNSRLWITPRGRGQPAAPANRLDRPLPSAPPRSTTDIEETLSALSDLIHQGKIRAFGCSTFPPEEIVEAHAVANERGLLRFRSEQPPYSILTRGIERSVLPLCLRYRMGVLTWSPLGWGFLTGRIRRDAPIDLTTGSAHHDPTRFDPSLPENQRKLDAVEDLLALAGDLHCTLPQLAIAFPLVHPAVTSVILGPRTPQQLEDLLAGSDLELDDTTLDRIDEIVPPGTDLIDFAWKPPALTEPSSRRRPLHQRAASA